MIFTSSSPSMHEDSRCSGVTLDTLAGKLSIELELTVVLGSEQFRKSQRASAFLRYVVEQALAGRANELKERTIGVAVFARAGDYDTAADAFVRVRANDVRRRLAQYYDSNPPRQGVRIELKAGSYVPRFVLLQTPEAARTEPVAAKRIPETPAAMAEPKPSVPVPPAMPLWQLAAPTAIALFLAIVLIRFDVQSEDAYSHFWARLLAHRTAIRISLEDSDITGRIPQDLANAALPFSEVARNWKVPLSFTSGSHKEVGHDLRVSLRLMPQQKQAQIAVDPDRAPNLQITASSVKSLELAVNRLCSRSLFPPGARVDFADRR